jgi:hypothetical protein
VSATNDGDNWRARIAAISAFGNPKGGRAPAIRVEGPNPLQDYVIGVLRKVTRMSALGHKQTFRTAIVMSALAPEANICGALAYVCFGPKADIHGRDRVVGYGP